MAPCIGVECQLEVGSTVVAMRWRNHDDQSAPYGNAGQGAELVLPIVSCLRDCFDCKKFFCALNKFCILTYLLTYLLTCASPGSR